MGKYSQVRSKELVKFLEKNGFIKHHQTGSHLTLKNSESGKRVTVHIHSKPLGKGLLLAILK